MFIFKYSANIHIHKYGLAHSLLWHGPRKFSWLLNKICTRIFSLLDNFTSITGIFPFNSTRVLPEILRYGQDVDSESVNQIFSQPAEVWRQTKTWTKKVRKKNDEFGKSVTVCSLNVQDDDSEDDEEDDNRTQEDPKKWTHNNWEMMWDISFKWSSRLKTLKFSNILWKKSLQYKVKNIFQSVLWDCGRETKERTSFVFPMLQTNLKWCQILLKKW